MSISNQDTVVLNGLTAFGSVSEVPVRAFGFTELCSMLQHNCEPNTFVTSDGEHKYATTLKRVEKGEILSFAKGTDIFREVF